MQDGHSIDNVIYTIMLLFKHTGWKYYVHIKLHTVQLFNIEHIVCKEEEKKTTKKPNPPPLEKK